MVLSEHKYYTWYYSVRRPKDLFNIQTDEVLIGAYGSLE